MNKEKIKKSSVKLATVLAVVLICLSLYTFVFMNVKVDKTWHVTWEGSLAEATEASLTAGASQFLEIFFLNHTATPWTAYDDNVSSHFETWCNVSLDADGAAGTTNHAYANADNFNLTLKWGTAMDIVIRCRWNKTHAWDGAQFLNSSCRINLTTTGGGIVITGETGVNVVSRNDTSDDFIWINVYWDNSGAGYTLAKNGVCMLSTISIQAKY